MLIVVWACFLEAYETETSMDWDRCACARRDRELEGGDDDGDVLFVDAC